MQTTVDRERGFITIRLTGPQTHDTVMAAFHEMTQHPEFDPSLNRLWDTREASLDTLAVEGLRRIQSFLRERSNEAGSARVAVLVSRNVDYGIGNMFRMMSEGNLPINFRAFRDPWEAEAWVGASGGDAG